MKCIENNKEHFSYMFSFGQVLKNSIKIFIILGVCFGIPLSFAVFEDDPAFVTGGIYSQAWSHIEFHQWDVSGEGMVVQPFSYRTDPMSWIAFAKVGSHNTYNGSLGLDYTLLFADDMLTFYGFVDTAYEYDLFVPQLSTGLGYWNNNRYFSMNLYLPVSSFKVSEHVRYGTPFQWGNAYRSSAYYYPDNNSPIFGGDVIVGYAPFKTTLNMYARVYLYNTYYWGGDFTVQYDIQLGTSYWPRNTKTYLSLYGKAGYDSSLFSTYRLGMGISFFNPRNIRKFRIVRDFTPKVKTTRQFRFVNGVKLPQKYWPK